MTQADSFEPTTPCPADGSDAARISAIRAAV
jgi:hypothetical protein